MLPFLLAFVAAARAFFRNRTDLALEVLALRQQVAVLKRQRPRPPLRPLDRLFWCFLRATWSRWKDSLVIVKPETVVGWHRAGFRLFWRRKSRPRAGRPRITEELRILIRRLALENSGWGAPRIHGELLKLGFVISERTVARYLRRVQRRGDPTQKWLAFLRNHREATITVFCDLIAGVSEELKVHRAYAAELGINLESVAPNPACSAYTDFLLRTAWQAPMAEIVAAMTPCMRLYGYLGGEFVRTCGPQHPYRRWIEAYSGEEFQGLAERLEALLDRVADDRSTVRDSYRYALECELDFFTAALTS